jgi:uncharacterized membrane protein (GlpM family)
VDLNLYITYFAHLLPILVFLAFWRRNQNTFSFLIFFYCLFSLFTDIARSIQPIFNLLPDFQHKDVILLSTFTIVEYFLLVTYVYLLLSNKKVKSSLIGGSVIFLIVALLNIVRNIRSDIPEFDSVPIAVSSIILIIGSISYFFECIQTPDVTFIYSKPNFWVIVGIMIYFAGTFFLFLQYDNLSDDEKVNFWTINLICFVLKNIFFSISFTLKPENQQPLHVDELYLKNTE